jgi:ATP-binding cassette subfamily D (ALD) long-chain fatty acid import protein
MRHYSEKEEIDLQLRAVPDLEERIKELELTSQ